VLDDCAHSFAIEVSAPDLPWREWDDLPHWQDAAIHELLDRRIARRSVSRGSLQRQHFGVHD
jgi:hypothetical protein